MGCIDGFKLGVEIVNERVEVIDMLRADEKIVDVDDHDGGVTIFRLEEDTGVDFTLCELE